MGSYSWDVVFTLCGTTIPLKFIESFRFDHSESQRVIDKLADDYKFKIRTLSGMDYEISTKHVAERINEDEEPTMLAQKIYNKWKRIHNWEG